MTLRYLPFMLTLALIAISLTLIITFIQPVHAGNDRDEAVHKALLERTNGFCEDVLPAWFKSELGIDDPIVRSLVTDCYTGHARLSILGVQSDITLSETGISEVPAALLQAKTGLNLDIYKPLGGRSLQTRRTDD